MSHPVFYSHKVSLNANKKKNLLVMAPIKFHAESHRKMRGSLSLILAFEPSEYKIFRGISGSLLPSHFYFYISIGLEHKIMLPGKMRIGMYKLYYEVNEAVMQPLKAGKAGLQEASHLLFLS